MIDRILICINGVGKVHLTINHTTYCMLYTFIINTGVIAVVNII